MGRPRISVLQDKEWLIEQYITMRKSEIKIAKEIGCCVASVSKWLRLSNIKTRSISEANKGRKLSAKQIENMSISRTGIGNPMYGKKSSPETKALLSSIRKGKKHSEEWCKHISESLIGNPKNIGTLGKTGPLSHSWRGGKSFEPYCYKFNEEFKEYIRNKFGRKCYICNINEIDNKKKLSVHHIDYNKNSICNGKSWAFVPLCKTCHNYTIGNRHYWFNRLISYYIENAEINLFSYGIWCW